MIDDNSLTKTEANELFSWIGNLEIALENLQSGVIDLFVADDSCSRRAVAGTGHQPAANMG